MLLRERNSTSLWEWADTTYRVRWGRVELLNNSIFSIFAYPHIQHISIFPLPVYCILTCQSGGRSPALHVVILPCIPPFCLSYTCPPPTLPPSIRHVQHIKGTVAGPCTTFSLLFIPGRQTPSQQPCPSPDLACPTAAAVVEVVVAPCP